VSFINEDSVSTLMTAWWNPTTNPFVKISFVAEIFFLPYSYQ